MLLHSPLKLLSIFAVMLLLFPLYATDSILATVPNLDVLLHDVLFMEVVQPEAIRYSFKIRPAKNFGVSFTKKYHGVEMTVAQPYHGCSPLTNAHYLAGKIVLLQRGECSFVTKSLNAEAAGALAAIITDSDVTNDQHFIDMVDDGTDRVVNIPATFLLGKDGHMIKDTLEQLGLPTAVVNIPVNITGTATHIVSQPPWTLW
ncbi:protease-associated domain-containing protein 1-like [Dreissena polymorpha]|uniref:PA domain-containing protein n=1 Tax=Dreissena polymorpha TaxID=45954 RepID=A0A9D4IXA1_DREPO|nr:protease-associated domain-containing protein 1-like [Dreissena polymorpha]KAH3787972.1 hypothetical protein DPMN_166099 [Dreissena polymorpha]